MINPIHHDQLQKRLGYSFSDPSLLILALTHRSYSSNNNERLEFLGDALLNSTIAQAIYARFPVEQEGILSRLRSSLVKGETLANISREFSLSDVLIMGEGELKSGGFRRDSILADALEAIIGAIFVDGGMADCEAFILRIFKDRLANLSVEEELKDPKTRLQELLQSRKLPLPNYTVKDIQGKSHQQLFTVACETVLLPESPTASANSRRQAEKLAAGKALQQIEAKTSD